MIFPKKYKYFLRNKKYLSRNKKGFTRNKKYSARNLILQDHRSLEFYICLLRYHFLFLRNRNANTLLYLCVFFFVFFHELFKCATNVITWHLPHINVAHIIVRNVNSFLHLCSIPRIIQSRKR